MTSGVKGRSILVVSVVAYAALGVGVAVLAWAGAPPSRIVIALAASFVPYVAIVVMAPRILDRQQATKVAVAVTAVVGLLLVAAPPVLSDDVFRFAWEGRLWWEGFNPYSLPPDAAALAALRDDGWEGINNKPLASIYPPLSQALFALVGLVGGGVTMMKLVALATHLLTALVVVRFSDDTRVRLAIALNPLLLSAAALDGHLDILVGLALLATAWGLAHHRIAHAAVATICAVGLKLVGLVLAPLFLRKRRALLAVLAGSTALLAPMVVFRPPLDATSGPLQFAERWRGNESLFAIVERLANAIAPEDFAMTLARGLCVGSVFAVCGFLALRRTPPIHAARLVIWTTLLLSPQVHPWYLAWLLPLEAVAGRVSGFVWSATALVAYLPLDRWIESGVWEASPRLHALEYAVVGVAWVLETWLRRPNSSVKTGR